MSDPQPTEEQLRAYEEELSRLSSIDIVVQAVATLISIGGHRLGLGGRESDRDLEQARDAIDGARGLLPIVERRMPAAQISQLKGALSQLQMGYASLAQAGQQPGAGAGSGAPGASTPGHGAAGAGAPGAGATDAGATEGSTGAGGAGSPSGAPDGGETGGERRPPADAGGEQGQAGQSRHPGPAESSGRLWIPGR